MAPRGQRTYSCQCFLVSTIGLLVLTFIPLVIYHDQLLSTIRSLSTEHPTIQCPNIPPSTSMHHDTHAHNEKQSFTSTIYADITILDELSQANVLWVNKSSSSHPEAWGISMFHALHCVKMWRDSLSPATMMSSHVHSESEYAEHAEHCVSYLTQVRTSPTPDRIISLPTKLTASQLCVLQTGQLSPRKILWWTISTAEEFMEWAIRINAETRDSCSR